MKETLLIWWLSEKDYAVLTEEQRFILPQYIREEVSSREGRSGRGRLWVADGIDLKEIPWPDDHPNARSITKSNAGGIVFRHKDFNAIKDLPGLVTDLSLNTFVG
jgi:hypothetical protein